VIDTNSKRVITYDYLLKSAIAYGRKLNLEQSNVVTVVMPNSIDYLITYLACVFYGCIFAPIPYFLTKKEIEKTISYHSSTMVISDRNDLSILKNYRNFDFDEIEVADKLFEINLPNVNDEQIAALYYSSGTTGDPKGVLYTHANKFALISSIVKDFNFNMNTRHLSFLPFGHTASLNYNLFPSLLVGSNLFIASSFESIRGNFFETLSKNQITYTQIVPTIAQTLIKIGEDIGNLNLSSIQYIGCGSAPLSRNMQIEFQKNFGIPLANLYGLSETGPSHFDNPLEKNWEPGSIGVPLGVNECKISDDGEILLRGKNITPGYFQNERLTKESIIDGWFHTGDFGYVNGDKFYFQDRKKDLVIVGGINVYPAEIEDILYLDKRVIDCVVFGIEDRILGERLVACVTLASDNHEDSNKFIIELNDLCKRNLSSFKVPSIIYFAGSIPKTPSGKLKRKEVKSLFLSNQGVRSS
jgi:long-chain acyl-CoA synthetase